MISLIKTKVEYIPLITCNSCGTQHPGTKVSFTTYSEDVTEEIIRHRKRQGNMKPGDKVYAYNAGRKQVTNGILIGIYNNIYYVEFKGGSTVYKYSKEKFDETLFRTPKAAMVGRIKQLIDVENEIIEEHRGNIDELQKQMDSILHKG